MSFETTTPKTTTQLLNRLTEVERSLIRGSTNPDRLEYLRQVHFASDNVSEADMVIVKEALTAQFIKNSASPVFGATWQY